METRKLQLYVTEDQYQLLKQRAGKHGSIAAVVRELIDRSYQPESTVADPFVEWVRAERQGSGDRSTAEQAKRDLYRKPL